MVRCPDRAYGQFIALTPLTSPPKLQLIWLANTSKYLNEAFGNYEI